MGRDGAGRNRQAAGHYRGSLDKIALRRRRPDEAVEWLRLDRLDELAPLPRYVARWVADHAAALRAADPVVPNALYDRAADYWRPLLAIADAVGGSWARQAYDAAIRLTLDVGDDAETPRTMLLADIRSLFVARQTDRLSSEEIVAHLGTLDERPWAEYRNGRPITKTQLARALKPFKVSSGSIRLDDGSTPKGYYRGAFADAFARYLPLPPIKRHNAISPGFLQLSGRFLNSRERVWLWRFENPQNPSGAAGCGVVADQKGETGGWSADL